MIQWNIILSSMVRKELTPIRLSLTSFAVYSSAVTLEAPNLIPWIKQGKAFQTVTVKEI